MDNLSFLREAIEDKSKILLNNAWYFAIFMLVTILSVLIYYRQTQDEITPTIVLSLLWVLFWKNSTQKGKIFLIVASVFGYVHELLGVQYGYFTYLGGAIGGSPIWLIPGYGTIFWSSHNLWKVFEKSYSKREWFHYVNHFIVASFALLFAIDYIIFDLALDVVAILIKFSLALLLFNIFDGWRVAYFVGFFTVLTEFTGETLGTWAHPDFSLLSLMAGYIFLLWICLFINDYINGQKIWGKREPVAAAVLTIFYVFSLLGMIEV